MRFRVKTAVMAVLIGIFAVLLVGCNDVTRYTFDIETDTMDGKYVDMLIPFDEQDELYVDYNYPFRSNDQNAPDIPAGSEIVGYKDKGYRSVLFHMDKALYDTSGRVDIYHANIYPNNSFKNSEGNEIFCRRYKKMRIAVFDEKGNIISISDEIPMIRGGSYYIDRRNMNFDPVKNKTNTVYKAPVEEIAAEIVFGLLGIGGNLVILILALVTALTHKKDGANYKAYTIISAVMIVPSLVATVIRLRICMCTHLSVGAAVGAFFKSDGIVAMLSVMLSVAVLTFFAVKLYLQVKHKISEK